MAGNEEKDLAYLGENYVQLELAKRNFKVFKIFELGLDFLGENNSRLEVKTALPSLNRKKYSRDPKKVYEYKQWQFKVTTEKQRDVDFFICVVFEKKDQPPICYFILPKTA